jgi:hypothetical protein
VKIAENGVHNIGPRSYCWKWNQTARNVKSRLIQARYTNLCRQALCCSNLSAPQIFAVNKYFLRYLHRQFLSVHTLHSALASHLVERLLQRQCPLCNGHVPTLLYTMLVYGYLIQVGSWSFFTTRWLQVWAFDLSDITCLWHLHTSTANAYVSAFNADEYFQL